jgi:hypothetical protein
VEYVKAREKLMKMKLIILLLTLMASTGCTRDLDFNPYTTIIKEVIKNGKKQ